MFANVSEVTEGTRLRSDGGFTCIPEGTILTVQKANGELFVPCSEGKHYIDGQLEGEQYVGLYLER